MDLNLSITFTCIFIAPHWSNVGVMSTTINFIHCLRWVFLVKKSKFVVKIPLVFALTIVVPSHADMEEVFNPYKKIFPGTPQPVRGVPQGFIGWIKKRFFPDVSIGVPPERPPYEVHPVTTGVTIGAP